IVSRSHLVFSVAPPDRPFCCSYLPPFSDPLSQRPLFSDPLLPHLIFYLSNSRHSFSDHLFENHPFFPRLPSKDRFYHSPSSDLSTPVPLMLCLSFLPPSAFCLRFFLSSPFPYSLPPLVS